MLLWKTSNQGNADSQVLAMNTYVFSRVFEFDSCDIKVFGSKKHNLNNGKLSEVPLCCDKNFFSR